LPLQVIPQLLGSLPLSVCLLREVLYLFIKRGS
jgi:hypothetical protein